MIIDLLCAVKALNRSTECWDRWVPSPQTKLFRCVWVPAERTTPRRRKWLGLRLPNAHRLSFCRVFLRAKRSTCSERAGAIGVAIMGGTEVQVGQALPPVTVLPNFTESCFPAHQ